MNARDFAKEFLLLEVVSMHKAGVKLHLLSAMLHGIESAGAMLDSLPFKAKGQGRKRFGLALKKLFPSNYQLVNSQLDLYGVLRSHMSHTMLPAKQVIVHANSMERHLSFDDSLLSLSLNAFYQDYRAAILSLINQLDSGKLKNKRIVFENLELILERK